MDKNESKGIGAGWFKSNILNKSNDEEIVDEKPVKEDKVEMVEDKTKDVQQIKNMLSKNNKDKIVVDLIMPLENLIKDRQMVMLNNSDLEDKLKIANEAIDRMKKSIESHESRLENKEREILTLEENLTNKQMSYDQLLENYREFQKTSSNEYEEISNRLNMEVNKYKKFNEEVAKDQYASMQKINTLEEKIRSIEIEKQQYINNYDKVYEEKTELMKSIDEFTKRMTFSFPSKSEDNAKVEDTKKTVSIKKDLDIEDSIKPTTVNPSISTNTTSAVKPGTTIKTGATSAVKPGTTINIGATNTAKLDKDASTNKEYTPNPANNQNIMDAINRIRTINTGKPQE